MKINEIELSKSDHLKDDWYDDHDDMLEGAKVLFKHGEFTVYINYFHDRDPVIPVMMITKEWKGDPKAIYSGTILFKNDLNLAKGSYYAWPYIHSRVRGTGIAYMMYKAAIVDLGFTLISDDSQTIGSKQIWMKLAKDKDINLYKWNKGMPDHDINRTEFELWNPDEDTEEEVWADVQVRDDLSDKEWEQRAAAIKKRQNSEITHAEYSDEVSKAKKTSDQELADYNLTRYLDVRLVAVKK